MAHHVAADARRVVLVGALLGGIWMIKLGLRRAMFLFAIVQALTNLGFRSAGMSAEGREHRWVRDLRWCALTVDEEQRVLRVRYLEPSMSWQAP